MQKKRTKQYFFQIIGSILLILSFALFENPVLNRPFKIVFFTLLIFIVVAILVILMNKEGKYILLNPIDLCFTLLLGITCVKIAFTFGINSDLSIIEQVILALFLYFPIRAISIQPFSRDAERLVVLIYIIALLLLVIKSIFQSDSVTNIHNNMYNSTYFSNYLSINIALLWVVLEKGKKLLIRSLSLFLITAILTIDILNNARGALISTLIFFVLLYRSKLKINFTNIGTIVVLLLLLFYFFILPKSDSIWGRLYIWEYCCKLIVHNPFGIGLGNFKIIVTNYQSDILKGGIYDKRFLLADINDFAFNDFLQLIVECGITAIAPTVLLLYYLAKSKDKYILPFVGMVTFMGFTSYIYHSFASLLLIILTFSILSSSTSLPRYFRLHQAVIYLLIFIVLTWSFLGLFSYTVPRNYSFACSSIDASIRWYRSIDNKYIYDSAMQEYINRNYNGCISLLQSSGLSNYDIDANIVLGNCFERRSDFLSAEKYYNKANRILPRIFKPKYYLFNLYKLKKDTIKLNMIAKEIIDTPMKISSVEIAMLKREASKVLHSQNNIGCKK